MTTYPILNSLVESASMAEHPPHSDWGSIARWLAKNAKPWLEVMKRNGGKALYRGMNGVASFPEGFVSQPRDDRRPSDFHPLKTEIVNKVLQSIKFKGSRYSSLFCTPLNHIASGYGTTHVIFPLGPYQVCSSRYYQDLIRWQEREWVEAKYHPDYEEIFQKFGLNIDELEGGGEYWEYWQDGEVMINERSGEILNFRKPADVKRCALELGFTLDPDTALNGKGEVLLHCSKYYAIHEAQYSHVGSLLRQGGLI